MSRHGSGRSSKLTTNSHHNWPVFDNLVKCQFDVPQADQVDASDVTYIWTQEGLMNSGVPNMAFVFGYLRTSWTMRVDLICDYVCKLLNHMDDLGARVCTPTLREQDREMAVLPWVGEEEFNPGYMQRSVHLMPKRGDHEPWTFSGDYYIEKDQLPLVELDEDTLVYK